MKHPNGLSFGSEGSRDATTARFVEEETACVMPATTDDPARIAVIGAGYVGLVTGACLAELGHTVTCVEIDPDRLARIERGELPIYEPGLDAIVARNRSAGRLVFTDEHATALRGASSVFIAVNTPPRSDGQADTSYVFAAVRSILAHAEPHAVVVTKSTVPVGTGDAIDGLAADAGRWDVSVVSNPEFLREGRAVRDFMVPDRIVIGTARAAAGTLVARLYATIDAPMILTDRRSAELAKYAANAVLATRISFVNEMAVLAETLRADIQEVTRIVGSDRRIGPSFLQAGLGWGGSCFPKDVRALAATAAEAGCRSSILPAIFEVNVRQRDWAVQRLLAMVETIPRATITVLGVAFKPDTDDIREAPAIEIIQRLIEAGVDVRAHDPVAMDHARRLLPDVRWCVDAYEAAWGSDALLLATEWGEYRDLDWRAMRDQMRGWKVLDGRNALDGEAMATLGFTYHSVGRPSRSPEPVPLPALRRAHDLMLHVAASMGDD